MITKQQAVEAGFKLTHFAHKTSGERWRSNGLCKTWARRPTEFKLPIKRGLQEFGYITHFNAHEYYDIAKFWLCQCSTLNPGERQTCEACGADRDA